MDPNAETLSWFEPPDLGRATARAATDAAFVRLWSAFMTARVMIALAVLLLQALIHALGQPVGTALLTLCGGYLVATLTVRVMTRWRPAGRVRRRHWLATVGVDLIAFSGLQLLHSGSINYTPLFGLPLLLASALGPLMLALATAASSTLFLLGDAWWQALLNPADGASRLLQAGLAGAGYFVVALLVNQLASRLAREEELAMRSQTAARIQTQVNELVIETLSDGVLVADADGLARAANPAAHLLLGGMLLDVPCPLDREPGWRPLADLVRLTFEHSQPQLADVAVSHAGHAPRRVRVRTRLTSGESPDAPGLCVMFLHDLREMEARLRTEKLAAMGRMSAAVAHEIRNPLAAIVQANALLDEDLQDPAQKRLALMVRQNAQRLARIAEEILDISRVQRQFDAVAAAPIKLDAAIEAMCRDWSAQPGERRQMHLSLDATARAVEFESDHLRRVLVNLLDNARRYVSDAPDALQVATRVLASGQASLQVWSDGQPLEKAVEQHLFEPFFSSDSRSTGLGLYICRELCERHGAAIGYQRATRSTREGPRQGNEFFVTFRAPQPVLPAHAPLDSIVV